MAKATNGRSKSNGDKREIIAPKGDKRYIKRDPNGRIKESDDQGRSLSSDRRKTAKTKVKPGYGDRGDQSRKSN